MTEQALNPSNSEKLLKPKRKWRWLKIVVGLSAGLFLILSLVGTANSPKIEVTQKGAYSPNDGMALDVVNVGTLPITIKRIMINDRTDCLVSTRAQEFDRLGRIGSGLKPNPANDLFQVATISVGDTVTYIGSCRVIRATIDTNQGSSTYTFRAS